MALSDEPHAASEVFAIPELLENILVFADTLHLFVLQSVNSTFRDTIRGSKEIRQRMCLEPSSGWKGHRQLRDLLEGIYATRATGPFNITMTKWPRARRFTVELRRGRIESYDCRKYPSEPLRSSLSTGSWREVKIGQLVEEGRKETKPVRDRSRRWESWLERLARERDEIEIDVRCDYTNIGSTTLEEGEDATLGDLVDAALQVMIVKLP